MSQKSRFRTKKVSADIQEECLLVDYVLEYQDSLSGESFKSKRQAKLSVDISSGLDVRQVANDLIERNKCVSSKFRSQVESCIEKLVLYNTRTASDHSTDTSIVARVSKIPLYLNCLYDACMDQKILGAGKILELCVDIENLNDIVTNHQLMSAIVRLLNDCSEKANDVLRFHLVRILMCLSDFDEFHIVLSQLLVGSSIMNMIHRHLIYLQKVGRPDEHECKNDELCIYSALILLKNLSSNIEIERKMVGKGLLEMLSKCLGIYGKNCVQVSEVILEFLLKLTIVEANVIQLICCEIVHILCDLLIINSVEVVSMTLKVLFNLSFNIDVRKSLTRNGIFEKIINLLKRPTHRAKSLCLLYHMSVDLENLDIVGAHKELANILYKLILNFPKKELPSVLLATLINLSLHHLFASRFLGMHSIRLLLSRFRERDDILLLKVLRNLSISTYHIENSKCSEEISVTKYWQNYIHAITKLFKEVEDEDALLELMGTVSNLIPSGCINGLPMTHFTEKHAMIPFIEEYLQQRMARIDLITELVVLVGELCIDDDMALLIAQSNIIPLMDDQWCREEDDELILQLLSTSFRFLLFSTTREVLFECPNSVKQMLGQFSNQSLTIAGIAERCLMLVYEYDIADGVRGAAGKEILKERFLKYNSSWVTAVTSLELSSKAFDSNTSEVSEDTFV